MPLIQRPLRTKLSIVYFKMTFQNMHLTVLSLSTPTRKHVSTLQNCLSYHHHYHPHHPHHFHCRYCPRHVADTALFHSWESFLYILPTFQSLALGLPHPVSLLESLSGIYSLDDIFCLNYFSCSASICLANRLLGARREGP